MYISCPLLYSHDHVCDTHDIHYNTLLHVNMHMYCTHMRTYTYVHTCTGTHTHARTHARTCTHTHTHMRVHIHTQSKNKACSCHFHGDAYPVELRYLCTKQVIQLCTGQILLGIGLVPQTGPKEGCTCLKDDNVGTQGST